MSLRCSHKEHTGKWLIHTREQNLFEPGTVSFLEPWGVVFTQVGEKKQDEMTSYRKTAWFHKPFQPVLQITSAHGDSWNLLQITTKNLLNYNKEPFQTGIKNTETGLSCLSEGPIAVIIHHDQMKLGKERVCSSLKLRSQPIAKGSQGRNSRQEPGGRNRSMG